MIYRQGDMIDTKTYGFVTVQAPLTFQENTNPKYDKLGGRTLYWVQDLEGTDLFLWDRELSNELTDDQKTVDSEELGENLWDVEAGTDVAIVSSKRRRK